MEGLERRNKSGYLRCVKHGALLDDSIDAPDVKTARKMIRDEQKEGHANSYKPFSNRIW
jgi:hypothetical protein